MAKTNEIRLDVSATPDFEDPASVLGTLVEEAEGGTRFILKHEYPGFDVAAGWYGRGRGGLALIFSAPRDGQRIPCSRA